MCFLYAFSAMCFFVFICRVSPLRLAFALYSFWRSYSLFDRGKFSISISICVLGASSFSSVPIVCSSIESMSSFLYLYLSLSVFFSFSPFLTFILCLALNSLALSLSVYMCNSLQIYGYLYATLLVIYDVHFISFEVNQINWTMKILWSIAIKIKGSQLLLHSFNAAIHTTIKSRQNNDRHTMERIS